MWPFKRRLPAEPAPEKAATAVVEWAPDAMEDAGAEELRAELDRLEAVNRAARSLETERRLLMVRHLLGLRLRDAAISDPRHPDPTGAPLPETPGIAEIAAADLTPELLRAGILRDGCVLVRGLVSREEALALAGQIDRSFAERELVLEGRPAAEGYYEEFTGGGRLASDTGSRVWIRQGGGVLAGDSPMLSFELFELLRTAGLRELVGGYLGEPPLISFEKTTLRKATPDVAGAWHQDGKFMGPVNSMNVWISLSRCGDVAPGLDVIPKRFDDFVENGTRDTRLANQVPQSVAEEVAEGTGIFRPIFEPGDVMLFDEMFLHQTGSEASMPNPRYAIESWFFGPSAFPEGYVPIAA
ncbi:MAG: hypothetical protein LH624_01385 [Cryobacterium sp.]|nr:hypothetical protein [Cryobacterium sp.]